MQKNENTERIKYNGEHVQGDLDEMIEAKDNSDQSVQDDRKVQGQHEGEGNSEQIVKNENVSEKGDQIGDKSENSERYALDKGENSVNNVQTLNETFGRKENAEGQQVQGDLDRVLEAVKNKHFFVQNR